MRTDALRRAFVVILMLAGCETATTVPPPPPAQVLPDLRGTWSGSWGGAPLTLAVLDQDIRPYGGGVYVGSWPVFGDHRPGVTGLATFTNVGASRPTSAHMEGWFGAGNALVIHIKNPDGYQELVLKVEGERLTGAGTSNFRWGPHGPVELTRTVRARP